MTGTSKSIDASIAEHLAAAGASVVVNYVHGKADANHVVDHIKKKEDKAVAVQGDVGRSDDIQHLFAETKKAN